LTNRQAQSGAYADLLIFDLTIFICCLLLLSSDKAGGRREQ
jgi:hypothetical protein